MTKEMHEVPSIGPLDSFSRVHEQPAVLYHRQEGTTQVVQG
jgi:hypothetical protein